MPKRDEAMKSARQSLGVTPIRGERHAYLTERGGVRQKKKNADSMLQGDIAENPRSELPALYSWN